MFSLNASKKRLKQERNGEMNQRESRIQTGSKIILIMIFNFCFSSSIHLFYFWGDLDMFNTVQKKLIPVPELTRIAAFNKNVDHFSEGRMCFVYFKKKKMTIKFYKLCWLD